VSRLSTAPLVLALETSCDDTCAAVVDSEGRVHSNVISSQGAHDRFGGVVPEIASRQHMQLVNLIVGEALRGASATLDDIGLIGVTRGPGLIGALLVGLCTAKALAAPRRLPLAAVDHLQGHVAANFLAPPGPGAAVALEPPFLCLIASGGHTLLCAVHGYDGFEVLGRTLDDAAGEAFDKGARMLGLGYPGGPALERLAASGDSRAFAFPGSREHPRAGRPGPLRDSLDFSFAGLKTSLLYKLKELGEDDSRARAADLAASYQAAIVESLMLRVERALQRTGLERLAVGGGVAANGELRARLGELGAAVHVPAAVLCTDNAAMIASAARYTTPLEYPAYLALDAYATGERRW
jgi:N6-L-threonylcarbamoyladenine synthase